MPAAFEQLRPSADALLAEASRGARGRLKIFLGAAPGVGKTYEMLSSAKTKIAQGVDVVVGIVETHGRAETQELLRGLPQLPRLNLEYRGRRLEEFDLDGMLARHPQLALVDELAHTNVPGSRHAKRYQDIQELLDAGIDVYTTLNVQHLESFNDLVMRITGIEIRETVPDAILEKATDVELIDLPPDELIERLRQGKVYVPEQARRALDNYFSRGNLLALRELALRAAAERVDDDLATFMRAHAIEGPWPARGRLLVCIDGTPAGEGLLRVAKRLADQRHLAWTALYVQTLGTVLPPAAQRQLDLNLVLAAQLGGETTSLTAERIGSGVLDYARTHNVAQIVVGRPRVRRWQRFWRGSLAQWLFEQADEFEVTVVGKSEPLSPPQRRVAVGWRRREPLLRVRDVVMTCGVSAAATAMAVAASPWLDVDNLSSIFLVAVAVAGSMAGLAAALLASVLSFLAYNFLFTEPRFTLLVNDAGDVRALVAFLIVAVVVGVLAGRLKRQASDAERNALRTELLFDFARRLATAINEQDLRHAAANGLEEILQVRSLVLEATPQGRVQPPADPAPQDAFGDTDQAAADWALKHVEPAGAGTTTLPGAGWSFLPVGDARQAWGVIALQERSDELSPEDRRLLFSLQAQLAAAWERLRLRRLAEDAKLQRAAESLRSALLASVSHDLRTPLVAIIGSLTAIRDLAGQLSAPDQAQLIRTALDEAERLNRLIQNLLDATRLAQGGLSLRLTSVPVQEVVTAAALRLPLALAQRVQNEVGENLPAVRADRVLLEQSLINLMENAGKYSSHELPIRIDAAVKGAAMVMRVIDYGPGIAPTERARIFDFFFRVEQRDSGVPGSGLGLAISKGFIEAMGGAIKAQAGADGKGTVIEIELPIDDSGLSQGGSS